MLSTTTLNFQPPNRRLLFISYLVHGILLQQSKQIKIGFLHTYTYTHTTNWNKNSKRKEQINKFAEAHKIICLFLLLLFYLGRD